jgi:hypothetical protein
MRRKGFEIKNGFVVMAIPDSGLFVKDGKIVSGHETTMSFSELILFSRKFDADKHAAANQIQWEDSDANGHVWSFQVIPVLVSERL